MFLAYYYGAFGLALVALVVIQKLFGQVDRLLKRACGSRVLRLPISRLRERRALKKRIVAKPFSFEALGAILRLWWIQFHCRRRIIRRIESRRLEKFVRRCYRRGLSSPGIHRRLEKYVRYRKAGDVVSTMNVLERMTRYVQFSVVSPSRPLNVGMIACYERYHPKSFKPLQLILGMELWLLVLHQIAFQDRRGSTPIRKNSSFLARIYKRTLAISIGRIVLEGVAHEYVHLLQEINERLLSREFDHPKNPQRLPWRMWARCEGEAHLFGSPLWIAFLATGLLLPIVIWAAMRYKLQV